MPTDDKKEPTLAEKLAALQAAQAQEADVTRKAPEPAPAPPKDAIPSPEPAKEVKVGEIQGNAGSVANKAPAVPSSNPFVIRRRELERQLRAQSDVNSRQNARARATTQAMLAELKDAEAKYGESGLDPLTPRGNLLQAGEIQAQYPDHHLRWVNEAKEGRTELLESMGYTRVPGGKRGGSLALWMIPREAWARGAVVKQEQTDRTLRRATTQSRDDMVQELQKVFDKMGANIDADKVISREA